MNSINTLQPNKQETSLSICWLKRQQSSKKELRDELILKSY